jgi:hypothetical protein
MATIDELKAGATLTMLQVTQGLATGQLVPTVSADKLSVQFVVPVSPDPAAQFIWSEALASPEMLAFFGLDASQGARYVLVKLYSVPADPAAVPQLPQGSWPLPDIDDTEPYTGGPILQAWVQGSPDAPWKAACSSGSACFITDDAGAQVDAPVGVTLQPGTWSGSGCIGKPRKEFAGISSWAEGAPTS